MHDDFSYNYQIEIEPELPGDGDWRMSEYYFPENIHSSGMTIKVRNDGTNWVGHFEAGAGSAYGVWPTPDPNIMLVVHSGKMFLVNTLDPTAGKVVGNDVAIEVVAVPKYNLLLATSWTYLYALSDRGILWETDRIALDGLEITSISDGKITCIGDSYTTKTTPFVLDITNGSLVSGKVYPDNV